MSFNYKNKPKYPESYRNSIGNASISTISSSIAEEILKEKSKNDVDLSNIEDKLKSNPQKVKIDGSKSIQVGEVIYNFYTPPDRKQSFKFDNSSRANKSLIPNRCNKISRKYLITFIIVAVFISMLITVTCLLFAFNDENGDNPDKSATTETSSVASTELTTTRVTSILPTTNPLTVSTETSTVPTTTTTTTPTTTTTTTTTTSTTTTESPLVLLNNVKIFERHHWHANPPSENIPELHLPIQRIIIAHTADENETCLDEDDCKIRVKLIQNQYTDLKDIPFNFLIGGDGNVYKGRGFEFEGEHSENINTTSYNNIGICVAFIGNFSVTELSSFHIKAFESFLEYFIEEGMISPEYKLFLQDQLVKVHSPAEALYKSLKAWKNFYEISKIYRRDEWKAYDRCRPTGKLELPISHLIFDHTEDPDCIDLDTCSFRLQSKQYGQQLRCSYNDIKFNFIFGTSGMVFEGRGFDEIGENLKACNDVSLGIGFIGNFNKNLPNSTMIENLLKFIDDGVALGKIAENFEIHAIGDLTQFYDASPGTNFREILENWPQFSNVKNCN